MKFLCNRYLLIFFMIFLNLAKAENTSKVNNKLKAEDILKNENTLKVKDNPKTEDISKDQIGNIIIKEVWVRPSRLENSAAYMVIENKGSVLDQLISAETTVCDYVELHRIEEINGVFHMKKVEAIDIPAGSSTILKPGGMHVMLMKLRRPLKVSEKIDLKLVFAKAGTITLHGNIQLNVRVKPKGHEAEELNLGIH